VFFFVECFSTLGKVFVECPKKVLGKELFADKIFTECKIAFRHSAENVIPVVQPALTKSFRFEILPSTRNGLPVVSRRKLDFLIDFKNKKQISFS
jgi:hypothetical protein